jgi:pyrroloquinoline-quinone synthase
MNFDAFWSELQERIGKYDLLCHPFYQAWSAGELTREDLGEYAADYYHHVAAFPTYLSALHARLEDGELRRAVLRNLCDEEGADTLNGRAHSELWLDFAEGMGAGRAAVQKRAPVAEVGELVGDFRRMARDAAPEAAMAAFYAYESQVPRVAEAKARGLREFYGADEKTRGYFALHTTADVHHAQAWRQLVERGLAAHPERAVDALEAAEAAAQSLWRALDGIERERQGRKAAVSV